MENKPKRVSWNKGRTTPEEVKIKMRASHNPKSDKNLTPGKKGQVPWNKGLLGWNKGHIVTEETRLKIGKAHKGKTSWAKGTHLSEGTKAKISAAHTGTKASPEARLKMKQAALAKWAKDGYRDAHSGEGAFRYNQKATSETKEKLRISMEPILKSPAYIEKQRVAKTKFWQDPVNREKVTKANLLAWDNPERKKKCSERFLKLWQKPEHIKNMSERNKGENSPSWLGGISKLPYSQDWTEDLKDAIRKRDNYSCQVCSVMQEDLAGKFFKKLDVHHIDYDKENCDPRNLISLCHSCHVKTNHKRDLWLSLFTNTATERIAINAK